MIKMIHNADDFGYSASVNYAIIDSHRQGMLTSTTLMANMPGFYHAVHASRQNPKLGIGCHLNCTCGKPLLRDVPSLVDEQGDFLKRSVYLEKQNQTDLEELYREWKAQIQKCLDSGIQLTHLDSHHHSHTFGDNIEVVIRLSKEFQLPVRSIFGVGELLEKANVAHNTITINPWKDLDIDVNQPVNILIHNIQMQLKSLPQDVDCIEVMWHPAYIDQSLLSGSGFVYPRLVENEAIKDKQLIEWIQNRYELLTYKDI